jgi:hypothetical protein
MGVTPFGPELVGIVVLPGEATGVVIWRNILSENDHAILAGHSVIRYGFLFFCKIKKIYSSFDTDTSGYHIHYFNSPALSEVAIPWWAVPGSMDTVKWLKSKSISPVQMQSEKSDDQWDKKNA